MDKYNPRLHNGKPHKFKLIMAEMNFGGVIETVVTSHEFSLEKAREVLKNETIAVIEIGRASCRERV